MAQLRQQIHVEVWRKVCCCRVHQQLVPLPMRISPDETSYL